MTHPTTRARLFPRFVDRSIRTRVLGIVGMVAAVVLALGGFAAHLVGAGADRGDVLMRANRATGAALQADMMHDAIRADVLQVLSNLDDPATRRTAASDLDGHAAELRRSLATVQKDRLGPDVESALADADPVVDDYLAQASSWMALAAEDPAAARAAYPSFLDAFHALEDALPVVADAVARHAVDAQRGVEAQRGSVTRLLVGAAVGVVAVLAMGLLLVRSLVGPLRRVQAVLDGLAEGDLTGHADVDSRDEVGQMAAALERATARLRTTVRDIDQAAHELADSSADLSRVSARMSDSAAGSAANALQVSATAGEVSEHVQAVAAGTEQMSASIREIAKSTASASSVATDAVEIAQSTTALVTQLGDSSTEIGNVVKLLGHEPRRSGGGDRQRLDRRHRRRGRPARRRHDRGLGHDPVRGRRALGRLAADAGTGGAVPLLSGAERELVGDTDRTLLAVLDAGGHRHQVALGRSALGRRGLGPVSATRRPRSRGAWSSS